MSERKLHIVSFDIPYPANYGGVIDVFNRIKSLHKSGIKITLHTFKYDRSEAPELLDYCDHVYYYERPLRLVNFFSTVPFIALSRKNNTLLSNLRKNKAPILFEGLHCCYYLNHPLLKNRRKIVRMHNIEHDYYLQLAKAENNIIRKTYHFAEALKLKHYDNILQYADYIVTISPNDYDHYNNLYPNVQHIPTSHESRNIQSIPGKGNYILYHGKLSVPENENAVTYLIKNVFCKLNHSIIIAGMNPSKRLLKLSSKYSHISIVPNPNDAAMQKLVREAHINFLITFQATGLKLKLVKSLYHGRFCIVNSPMVDGTGLEPLCEIADTPPLMIKTINEFMKVNFSTDYIKIRSENLIQMFDPEINTMKWNKLLFP